MLRGGVIGFGNVGQSLTSYIADAQGHRAQIMDFANGAIGARKIAGAGLGKTPLQDGSYAHYSVMPATRLP